MPRREAVKHRKLEDVLAEFEKNHAEGKINILEMPAPGTPINTLRRQMALLIETVKDEIKKNKELRQEFNETVNDFMMQISRIDQSFGEVRELVEQLRSLKSSEIDRLAEEYANDPNI